MPIEIEGISYFYVAEMVKELGVSRQTLWRWRHEKKIPLGRRHRNGQVLFTEQEAHLVREYCNRVEPIDSTDEDQLNLFNGRSNG